MVGTAGEQRELAGAGVVVIGVEDAVGVLREKGFGAVEEDVAPVGGEGAVEAGGGRVPP